jgi:hypothetical protein
MFGTVREEMFKTKNYVRKKDFIEQEEPVITEEALTAFNIVVVSELLPDINNFTN